MRKKDTPMQNDGTDQLMDAEEGNPGGKGVQNDGTAVSSDNQEDAAGGDKEQDADNGEKNQESGGDADDGGVSEPEPPKILTAICPILYLSRQYRVGEELPANAPGMVEAWTVAGTAAATAGTAALGKLAQEAISAYSDYEQLVGGVETLFKTSSATYPS